MSEPIRTAAAVIIGNEILTGKIADANLVVLARTLRKIGIALQRAVTVLDDLQTISDEVRALSQRYDLVFTSGGVGPTHDDVTIDAVAHAFDTDVVSCEAIETRLRDLYGERLNDSHLRMARAPRGSELFTSPEMPWPTTVMKNVWILPGIPQIFAMKMATVRAQLRGAATFVLARLYTLLDEGEIKPMLDKVVAAHPNIEVGSYPKWREPRYRTMVTFDGPDEESVNAAKTTLLQQLPAQAVVELQEESE